MELLSEKLFIAFCMYMFQFNDNESGFEIEAVMILYGLTMTSLK